MLHITIPSNGSSLINFSTFERYSLPAPPNGADAEINGDLVLNFEDEEEAIVYSEQLEGLYISLKDKSLPQNLAIDDMITAIRNDEFVQSYLRQ